MDFDIEGGVDSEATLNASTNKVTKLLATIGMSYMLSASSKINISGSYRELYSQIYSNTDVPIRVSF